MVHSIVIVYIMGIDLSFFRFTYFEEIALQLFVLQQGLILILNLTQNSSCVTKARNSQLFTEASIQINYVLSLSFETIFSDRLW